MLKGDYIYIKPNRVQGISAKNQKPYDFANLTVSDGLESFEMACKPSLATALEENENLRKGDSIVVEVELTSGQRGLEYLVVYVKKVEKKELVKN
jgi:hypothetical protein